ncbi:histidine phosphatase family protein [Arthrobacter sp. MSA 4-2]|uniref:histidine phosphatase family protein n=1 Tax=Arthrobacter sp. MSA 4-2 TaxID=2794349 RepID=UPI0018E75818|nr:histidine phosphatase family protein [Arthrobacter sp. MSA 4-2]MBJ2121772.1 histidine phosphatase family protein [Arthrobacter sp. MSA 4-2]
MSPLSGAAQPDPTPAGTPLPRLWLLRHGETEWSRDGNYTGLTDLPLTPYGEEQALEAKRHLAGIEFDLVMSSPLQRAVRTAELAGFPKPEIVPHAHEWDYGDNEGRNSAQVRRENPDYLIWKDGAPNGETLEQVAARADRIISRVQAGCHTPADQDPDAPPVQNALLVAHGHFLRVVAARWLEFAPVEGRRFVLGTAAVCSLGWDKHTPAIVQWNL